MINPTKYPLRVCQYLNSCRICKKSILNGQQYYDGGYGRRFHKECAQGCNHKDDMTTSQGKG